MKDGIIFHGLGTLLLALMILNLNLWTLGIYFLYLIRIICLRDTRFLFQFVGIQIVLAMYFVYFEMSHHTRLSGDESQIVLDVAVTDIEVDGDLLSFPGTVVEPKVDKKESVQVFYNLADEEEQKAWLDIDQSIRIKIEGELEEPNKNANFYLFNYQDYLASKDSYWTISPDKITILDYLNKQEYWLANTNKQLFNWINLLENVTVKNYMLSLFFNQMDALDSEVLAAYQAIGLIHLFSISGFHVQYFLRFFKQIFLRIGVTVEAFDYIAIGILIAYTFILGLPYGMIRSAVAYIYQVIQRRRKQDPSALKGTAWAMILLIIVDPRVIFTLSFQLTFALAYTILFTGTAIAKKYKHPLKIEFIQSLTCTLVTIPFLVTTYFEFSWLALLLNYFYSWLFSAFLFPGLLIILLLHAGGLANLFSWFQAGLAYAIYGIEQLSLFAEKFTWFQWVTGKPQIWVLTFFIIALSYFLMSLTDSRLKYRTNIGMAIALGALYLNPYLHRYGQVAMLDIGQGDSLFIETPYQQETYLIDLAGKVNFASLNAESDEANAWKARETESLAERQIIPSLKAAGVRKITGVFLTHGDFDHIGSFGEVAAAFKINRLYLPIGMQEDMDSLKTLQAEIAASKNPKMEIIWLKQGDTVDLNKQTPLQVIAPSKVGEGENKDSLVLYGKIGPKTFLFTGDIEEKEEDDLPSLDVDILKVAHHGSEYSTTPEFIQKVKPEISWISVGKENRYGHPSDRVVKDLAAVGSKIYRTDLMGAVHYIYWPKSAKIEVVHKD